MRAAFLKQKLVAIRDQMKLTFSRAMQESMLAINCIDFWIMLRRIRVSMDFIVFQNVMINSRLVKR